MPYTTLVAGTTITASWANANVRDQVVSTFTDSTARASAITSPLEGMVSYLTGNNRLDVYNASSWSTLINPTSGALVDWSSSLQIQQSVGAIAATVNTARYLRVGRMVYVLFSVSMTGSGSAGQHVNMQLPFNHGNGALGISTGAMRLFDASAATGYSGTPVPSTAASGLVWFESMNSAAPDNRLGVVEFTAALASGDLISGSFWYQAAADA